MRPHMMEEPESKPAETEFTGALVGMALLLLSPLLLDDNAGLAYVSLAAFGGLILFLRFFERAHRRPWLPDWLYVTLTVLFVPVASLVLWAVVQQFS